MVSAVLHAQRYVRAFPRVRYGGGATGGGYPSSSHLFRQQAACLRVRHIMAVVQLRHPTQGRAYYDRKVAAGKIPTVAMQALKRRLTDAACRQMTAGARAAQTGPGGHVGRLLAAARPAPTPSPALRRSHFPDPHLRPYADRPARSAHSSRLLRTNGPQPPPSALYWTAARTSPQWPGGTNHPLDTDGSQMSAWSGI